MPSAPELMQTQAEQPGMEAAQSPGEPKCIAQGKEAQALPMEPSPEHSCPVMQVVDDEASVLEPGEDRVAKGPGGGQLAQMASQVHDSGKSCATAFASQTQGSGLLTGPGAESCNASSQGRRLRLLSESLMRSPRSQQEQTRKRSRHSAPATVQKDQQRRERAGPWLAGQENWPPDDCTAREWPSSPARLPQQMAEGVLADLSGAGLSQRPWPRQTPGKPKATRSHFQQRMLGARPGENPSSSIFTIQLILPVSSAAYSKFTSSRTRAILNRHWAATSSIDRK